VLPSGDAFYLLQDFPGRYTGATVWVQRDQDRTNDSVSPVIIGGNDWGAAWAMSADGNNPYAVIPGGQRQRILAYRFGVNLVMYALTGNYKGDQVHVPAILQRLGPLQGTEPVVIRPGQEVDVAELHAPFAHQELIISEALGLGDGVSVNPSGGALAANPMMSAGLIRIGESAQRIWSGEADRAVAHATSGPCLQQNLVCVLEGV